MKKTLHTLFLFTSAFGCFAQNNELPWTKDLELTWTNFKGPAQQSEMSAETHSGIVYEAGIRSNSERVELEIEVYSFFNESKSWKKPGKLTPELLMHEQVHLDITELYARILRKSFKEYSYADEINRELLDEIFRRNKHQLDSVQIAYDTDTDHSRFIEGQKLWEKFVENSLDQFSNFSDRKVSVIILKKD